ncbi:glycosyltransferase [Streptomyces sp. NPDC001795]|uniref:glycosyltransferase family 4 protein n=1 Tax=Streptomyces sp. NPDC001795 TaxID=3154525 RepID=UPI00331F6621
MPDEQRQRILVLCDESGMGLGGVPVFNEQISMALAARGHDVTLLTVKQVQGGHEGVTLRTVQPAPENIEGRHWLEQQVTTQHPTAFGLPDPREQSFDLIIGHSRFSGPAAVAIRDTWYTEARVTHFLHTSPERLPGFKYPNNPARAAEKAARDSSIEQVIMNRADVVVGPLLTEEARKLASTNPQVPTSHELVPGTAIEPLVQRAQQQNGPLQLLALGRADDALKGFEDAAQAVKLLNDRGVAVHLTIRGVPDAKVPDLQQRFSQLGGGNVTVLSFSTERDAIRNDIRRADAVIMPSKHEGFGLVATEALGHGVPVLVNEDSGAARFLQDANRIAPELGIPCVVPEPADPSLRVAKWATAVHQMKEQLPERIAQASQLREILKSYSWENAATSLVQASVTAPAPATGASAAQQAHATVQGPEGTVLLSSSPPGIPPTQRGTATTVTLTVNQTIQVTQQMTQSTQASQPTGPHPQPPIAKAAALTSRGRSGTATTAQGTGSNHQGSASQTRPQIPQPPKPQGPSH